mgnify:CR=1 FL=1
MKILWNGGSRKIEGVYKPKGIKGYEKISTASVKGKDEVSISSKAKDISLVMGVLKGIPEIREEKVAELTEKINKGTYNVSGKDIIEKLFSQNDNGESEK